MWSRTWPTSTLRCTVPKGAALLEADSQPALSPSGRETVGQSASIQATSLPSKAGHQLTWTSSSTKAAGRFMAHSVHPIKNTFLALECALVWHKHVFCVKNIIGFRDEAGHVSGISMFYVKKHRFLSQEWACVCNLRFGLSFHYRSIIVRVSFKRPKKIKPQESIKQDKPAGCHVRAKDMHHDIWALKVSLCSAYFSNSSLQIVFVALHTT